MMHLRRVLEALQQTALMINLKKSMLGQRTIQYMGFHIGHVKIWVGPNKVAALRDITPPPRKRIYNVFWGLPTTTDDLFPVFQPG